MKEHVHLLGVNKVCCNYHLKQGLIFRVITITNYCAYGYTHHLVIFICQEGVRLLIHAVLTIELETNRYNCKQYLSYLWIPE